MDDRKFRESMDKWLSQEMKAAPEISPADDVYQKLSNKQKRIRLGYFNWTVRLAAAGLAAALIILVIVLQPPRELGPVIGLRKGTTGAKADTEQQILGAEREEKAAEMKEERLTEEEMEPEKAKEAVAEHEKEKKQEIVQREEKMEKTEIAESAGEKQAAKSKALEEKEEPKEVRRKVLAEPVAVAARPKAEEERGGKDVKNEAKISVAAPAAPAAEGRIVQERIEFQYQPKGSESIQELDIGTARDEVLILSSEDNYRLVLQLPRETYVYVYQVSPDQRMVRLFPNPEYYPDQNPLQPGKIYVVPLPPDWFYVEEAEGEEILYIVTTSQPKGGLDELYAQYEDMDKVREKKNIVSRILDEVRAIDRSPTDESAVYVFRFRKR